MRLTYYIPIFSAFLMLSCSNMGDIQGTEKDMHIKTVDLSQYSGEKPSLPLHLLFIHHSTGGHLMADRGDINGDNCIYASHTNGGGLRQLLKDNNYLVHEASYNSLVGDKTDICHWNAKFRDHMDKVLQCDLQDDLFQDGTRNRIVMFKSCYPNNMIVSEGTEPGDPDSCENTTANFKAAYRNLLGYFGKHPDTLFVVITAPPLARPKTGIKGYIKQVMNSEDSLDNIGRRARGFNNWLKDVEKGWLEGYRNRNVVVFDYYDVLTDYGRSNWSMYPTVNGRDSHPSSEGNRKAAERFISFLNKAVQRMGF